MFVGPNGSHGHTCCLKSRKVRFMMVHCAVHARCAALQVQNFASMTPTPPNEARPLPLLGEAALRDFIGAGSVTRLEAVGRPGGFDLRVHMGTTEATLGNTRGGVRLFASLEALTALLKRLEQPRFEVDATNYVTGSLRPPRRTRPSTAAALVRSETTKKPRPLR